MDRLLEHAGKIGKGESDIQYPNWADNGARKALADFFDESLELAIQVDAVVLASKPDSWVGHNLKEKKVKQAITKVLPDDFDDIDELFDLVKARHEYS